MFLHVCSQLNISNTSPFASLERTIQKGQDHHCARPAAVFSSLDHCPADLRKSPAAVQWGTFRNKKMVQFTIKHLLVPHKILTTHDPQNFFTIKILTKSSNTWDLPWKISWFWTIKKWGNPPSNSPTRSSSWFNHQQWWFDHGDIGV